jgi:hypothetical protein
MDIEVREENRPRRDNNRDGRGRRGKERGRDGKPHDRRPPGGKFHDHVASMEPTEVRPEIAAESVPVTTPQTQKVQEPQRKPKSHNDRHHEKRGSQRQHNEQAARPQAVDKNELPAFLFRPVPVRKPVPGLD